MIFRGNLSGEPTIQLAPCHLKTSHCDGFGTMISRCSDRDTTIFLNCLEVVISYMPGIIIGDTNIDIQDLTRPRVNKPINSDTKRLEFIMPVTAPQMVWAFALELTTFEPPMQPSLNSDWVKLLL